MSPAPRFLHVANGSSTTGLIHAAGISGATSIWADPLYEGPVPDGLSDEELLVVRATHLAEPGGRGGPDVEDIVAELTQWRRVISDGGYDELVLWFEHDLFDQLNLIQLLGFLQGQVRTLRPVSLVCVGSFPGHPRFKGLGELTPQELASLLDRREPVTAEQYGLAGAAWRAFRAANPQAIEELVGGDTSSLPFLAPALARHLEEFPWTTDGLSRTERRLLEWAASGPADMRAAFGRMHDRETAFYISDASFSSMVRALASSARPLVAVDAVPDDSCLPPGTIELTPRGREVLDGRVDRVRQDGLDRWLGGVHLHGFGPVWRWDPAIAALVER
jgi:hypothetical protein